MKKFTVQSAIVAFAVMAFASSSFAANLNTYAGKYNLGDAGNLQVDGDSYYCDTSEVDTFEVHGNQVLLTITYTVAGPDSTDVNTDGEGDNGANGQYAISYCNGLKGTIDTGNTTTELFDCAANGVVCEEDAQSPGFTDGQTPDSLLLKDDGFVYTSCGTESAEDFLTYKMK
jgi:hypothetical protein